MCICWDRDRTADVLPLRTIDADPEFNSKHVEDTSGF